ncbi:phospholipase-like protein [Tanacetum coccineum]
MKMLKSMLEGVSLNNSNDRWSWSLDGTGDFSVSSVRRHIDDHVLPSGNKKTRWIKEVPIKINIHAWKVSIDGLPTRFNHSRRGVEIDSIMCPLCDGHAESSNHLFFSCKIFYDTMQQVSRWWELDFRELTRILQLVLLGVENRPNVPEWLLRIANDRGNIPVVRLTPDDIEARSDWWISSKAYFDRFIDQVERVPFDLSRQNMYEIPSGIYRQFVEQKIKLERNKKDDDDIKEEMQNFREEMNARPVRQENTVPIIVRQHYGLSNFSEFRSMQMPEQSASHYWQPSSHPGSYYSFGQVPSHMGRPNLQTTIDTQHDVDGIVDQNIPNRGKRQQLPSKYLVTPFTVQAPTTMVPKQRVSKSKNKGKTANLSPLNLGGVFEGYNEEENNVTFFGSQFTGNILFYENVDPAKVWIGDYENIMHFLNNPYQIYLDCYMRGYTVPVTFWQELAPHFCRPDMQRYSYGTPIGWLGGELLIRRRPLNANWTVAYTSTISVHPKNNQFIIVNDHHVIGTLDGSTRQYPSWNDVDWVFLPIHVAGNHWATGVIHLANSHFYMFDSMASEENKDVISLLINC